MKLSENFLLFVRRYTFAGIDNPQCYAIAITFTTKNDPALTSITEGIG